MDKITYKSSDVLKGFSENNLKSNELIDIGTTYERYFILKGNEDCINISFTATVFDKSLSKNTPVKIFFVIEKVLDLKQFSGSGNGITYLDMNKNYDHNWSAKERTNVCSSKNPLSRLNKDDRFRIRFTAFSERRMEYNITILSNNGIVFME